MNRDVLPVAELNFPSARSDKFTWDLSPAEVANISRKHRSVAKLNVPSAGSDRFGWDLNPNSRSNNSEDETGITMTDRWAVITR